MNTDPKDTIQHDDQDDHHKETGYKQEKNEDNDVQEGLTGEIDEDEDVAGDIPMVDARAGGSRLRFSETIELSDDDDS